MTARTDLDSAIATLTTGISAHVQALVDARNASVAALASAQASAALAADETYIQGLVGTINSLAAKINSSLAAGAPPIPPAPPATPAAPVAPPAAPTAPAVQSPASAAVVAAVTAALPTVTQAAPAAQTAPVALAPLAPLPVAVGPVVTAHPLVPAHTPSVLETMQAAIASMAKNIP